MGDLIKSKITIAGKDIPLKLSAEESKIARLIESEIAEKLQSFQQHYGNISLQDCLAMICIEQAFALRKQAENSGESLEKVLGTLEEELAK